MVDPNFIETYINGELLLTTKTPGVTEVFTFPLVPIPTPVSPLPLPLKEVAVIIPDVLIFPVLPIPTPVNPLPLPLKEVAVMIPTLKVDGGEILVENPARLEALDILLF